MKIIETEAISEKKISRKKPRYTKIWGGRLEDWTPQRLSYEAHVSVTEILGDSEWGRNNS